MAETSSLTKFFAWCAALSGLLVIVMMLVPGKEKTPIQIPASSASQQPMALKHLRGTKQVSKTSFKGLWPLRASDATIRCELARGNGSTIRATSFQLPSGENYALTGFSSTFLKIDLIPLSAWAPNPQVPGLYVDISDLRGAAESLCAE